MSDQLRLDAIQERRRALDAAKGITRSSPLERRFLQATPEVSDLQVFKYARNARGELAAVQALKIFETFRLGPTLNLDKLGRNLDYYQVHGTLPPPDEDDIIAFMTSYTAPANQLAFGCRDLGAATRMAIVLAHAVEVCFELSDEDAARIKRAALGVVDARRLRGDLHATMPALTTEASTSNDDQSGVVGKSETDSVHQR